MSYTSFTPPGRSSRRYFETIKTSLTIFIIQALILTIGLLLSRPAQADYNTIRAYYNQDSYYSQGASLKSGWVLSASTTAGDLDEQSIISGYIEKYPNPDTPDASQYFIGVQGQGLVEISPDQIPEGINIDQLIGQHVALGTVNGEQILAPAPPKTDPVLVQAAAEAVTSEPDPPALPAGGISSGLIHNVELAGESIFDSFANAVNPAGAPRRAFNRAAERCAEASNLILAGKPAAKAVHDVGNAMENIFKGNTEENTVRQLEPQIAGIQTTVEELQVQIPEGSEAAFGGLRSAVAGGADLAADALGRPPITTNAVQVMQSLKNIGILQKEQAEFIYGLQSRDEVRDAFEDFKANGYLTQADITGALDETAAALYPTKIQQITQIDKLQALNKYEAVKPDAATLAELDAFSSSFIPGVTPVPANLAPFWVASVNLDRLQQTIRPDLIPDNVLLTMKNKRPSSFAKFKELEHRFKPSLQDIASLEQYRAQLREQHPDAENIDDYLPPQFKRIASFHDKFGLKEPEGWKRPRGLTGKLPFAGPGGLHDPDAIDQYCSQNDCDNWAPPSGYALTPPVGVTFGLEDQQGPPIFPGLRQFRAPVAVYDLDPKGPAQYVGPSGCTNPAECLQAFQALPPEQRSDNFFVTYGPPPDAADRPDNYKEMSAEERRAYWAEKASSGEKPPPSGDYGPIDEEGNPLPGPGALYDEHGSYQPGYGPGTAPYYPPYSQPVNEYDPYHSYAPPPPDSGGPYDDTHSPADTGPVDEQGNPLSGPGAAYPGDNEPAPPPDSPTDGDDSYLSHPESGIPDDQAILGPDDGDPSDSDPNAGRKPAPWR